MAWTEVEDAWEEITRAVGVNSDGWVPNEDYERVVGVNETAHMAWVKSMGKEEKKGLAGMNPVEVWPFQGKVWSHWT
ncbi:hypothetical protein BDN70DRAFT_442444 [Pholiota conissans]|uniref:Uncharacterized protein n=1 Tax=Pholiota conissans TaxID=109636 RepID=A0A9P5YS68_9AGAR|nr:hypothetical protein BDN70DRAFT_442444 [Pholiota conissans]